MPGSCTKRPPPPPRHVHNSAPCVRPRLTAVHCRACSYVAVFHYLANLPTGAGNAMAEGVLARFWMQPDAAVAVMLGCGVIAAAECVPRLTKSSGAVIAVGALCMLLCAGLPLLASLRLDEMDRSDEGGAAMSR